jgi:hypothetical protein
MMMSKLCRILVIAVVLLVSVVNGFQLRRSSTSSRSISIGQCRLPATTLYSGKWNPSPAAPAGQPYGGQSGGGSGQSDGGQENARTFASFVIYKSKAAVSIKVIPASFETIPSKFGGHSRVVSREGGLFLEFASSSGPREYDWSKKGTFLLSATECGDLLMLDKTSTGLEFFHDPNMGAQNAGQVTKKVKFATAPDGKGLFLSLAVNDKATQSAAYSVPVSWGELQVMKSIVQYSIPHFLGFDQALSSAVTMNLGDEGSSMGSGSSSMFSAPPPPAPPVFKDFWGNKEQVPLKP